MTSPLSIEHLQLRFPDRPVFEDITGDFPVGRIHLVIGPSGCGKTSFLLIVAGFLPPSTGWVRQGDQPWQPDGRVGLAFQNPEHVLFSATVGDEVQYALLQRGIAPEEASLRARAELQAWGLDPDFFWDRNPLQLSGGEKRRVALAATCVFEPPVLLLDEPFAGIDAQGQRSVLKVLQERARSSVLLLVTHEPEPLLPIADRILLINHGRGRVFHGGQSFLASCLRDPDLYPLPPWYRDSVESLPGKKTVYPWIDPDAVAVRLREAVSGGAVP